jgi:hypothetical protein
VSFILSALLVRTLPATPRLVPEVRESLLRQARAGASYVLRDRLLLGLALRPAVGNVAFLAVETVLALFAHDRLGIDTYGFGLLLTAEATGGLLGAGIASYLGRRLGMGTALTCTCDEALIFRGLGPSGLVSRLLAGTQSSWERSRLGVFVWPAGLFGFVVRVFGLGSCSCVGTIFVFSWVG